MLAEPKRKIPWSPNPCGNLWAKDTSKFGQKMLEKLGWTPGKGLGVNEQGITNPVRLKCNSTQKGLGYDRGNKLECFQHQIQFDSILSELSSSNDQLAVKESSTSLEQASKNCRTRVHYHKFTRGKDLSRYSEKDLSCILGSVVTIENRMWKSTFQETSSQVGGAIEVTDIPGAEDSLVNSASPEINIDNIKSNSKTKKKRKHLKEEAESSEIYTVQDKNETYSSDLCKSKKKRKRSKTDDFCELILSEEEPNRIEDFSEGSNSFNNSVSCLKKKKKQKKVVYHDN